MSRPLLAVRGLRFAYPERALFDALDFELRAGERLALLGDNGAGKTTLLHVLVGLLRPAAGQVEAFGVARQREHEFREVRARVGLLFQDPDDQLFCPTVLDDVAFGPLNLGLAPAAARGIAERTLASLGLEELAGRVTHRLSGGEKRLVSLATVLAMQPEVLLLDEPTNALDAPTRARLLDHLAALPQAMVLVSHDAGVIERLANRALLLRDGRLIPMTRHRHPHQHRHAHWHPRASLQEGEHAVDDRPWSLDHHAMWPASDSTH